MSYRNLVDIPKETREMTEGEISLAHVRIIIRGMLAAIAIAFVSGGSCNAYSSWTQLETARVNATQQARDAAQARAAAAKAEADRAMFESMRPK